MKFQQSNFKHSEFWDQLIIRQKSLTNYTIAKLFLNDHNRFKNFSIKLPQLNLLVDFSKQHIDQATLNILYAAARHCDLQDRIKDLFNGRKINVTEHKSVGHPRLRDFKLNVDLKPWLSHMNELVQKVYTYNVTDIICVGIGGSYLGPKMVSQALEHYTLPSAKKFKFHFIANFDQQTLNNLLSSLDPCKVILIISSKSFTTVETINNANFIKSWLEQHQLLAKDYLARIFAVTTKIDKAITFGIMPENILPFNDNIGGRYSVWSAVALPILIKIGVDNFEKFLIGAYLIDQHFQHTDFANNIPIVMGLISIWNVNFMAYRTLGVISYLDNLEFFPEYLQQLAMESNGKSIGLSNSRLDYDTVEVIFGGVGCNVQHSFMQMLHQGSQIIPVDFIVAAQGSEFLLANCLAQSQALMQGTNYVNADHELLSNVTDLFKHCVGNRPSTTILFPQLTPEVLGALIAIYEHKVFVQSVMWDLNAFDQWGVELGKNLANDILSQVNNKDLMHKIIHNQSNISKDLIDGSTLGLLQEYFNLNNI